MQETTSTCTVESRHYALPFATIALAKTVGGGAYLRDPANSLTITPHPLQEAMEPSY